MSFLKKLTKEFEELKTTFGGSSDKKPEERKDSKDQGHAAYPPVNQTHHPISAPSGQPGPPLPPGWHAQFDNNSRRWYYIEQATGRTQWDFPGHSPPPPQEGHHAPPGGNYQQGGHDQQNRGYDPNYRNQGHGYGAPAQYGAPYGTQHAEPYGTPGHGYDAHGATDKKDKKDKGNKNMMMAGAGGLAAGAVGGAVIANAMDDSDDEHHGHGYAAAPAAGGCNSGYGSGYGAAPPPGAPLPATDADGDSVSSSDREDVQEARADYEEALADAHDSDASSSDHERAQEAREEYEEEYEEAYGSD